MTLQGKKKKIRKCHWFMKADFSRNEYVNFDNLDIYSFYLSIYSRTNEMHYVSFIVAMFIKEYILGIFYNSEMV